MKCKGIIFSFFLCVLVLLGGCRRPQALDRENINTTVDFLDIGKADAICIFYQDKTIVIDTGEEEDGEKILSHLKQQKRKRIDHLIITHFDKDHVGGADVILNGIEVGKIWQPDYEPDKKQYIEYKEALEHQNIKKESVINDETIKIGDLVLTICPSGVKNMDKDNECSLIIRLKYHENSFFFAGDAEGKRLKELTEKEYGHYDVLKVPHHGKSDSNSESFFASIQPDYAIITSSRKKHQM